MDMSKLPKLSSYSARDEEKLYFRYYPSEMETKKVMILLHGISEDSRYLFPLARQLSEKGLVHVYTPDLRGYGENPTRRGDLDYVGQLDDDLNDFIEVVKKEHPEAWITLGGHSAGGGTAIRFANSGYRDKVDNFLLLSPFIHFSAPTMKKSSDDNNTTTVHLGTFIRLMIMNGVGFKGHNHLPIYTRNKPKEKLHGSETLTLSYRLFMSRIPKNYKKALAQLPDDTLVLIGDKDEEFEATEFQPLFSKYSQVEVELIKDADHDGVLSNQVAWNKIEEWILK